MLSLADADTIREHFPELIGNMKTDPVCDELYRLKVLTTSDVRDIMAERTTDAKNRKMLDIIFRGKKDDKLHLIAALVKAEQPQLAGLLEHRRVNHENDFVRSGHEVIDAKKILKDTYLKCFKTTNPFSLPFTFDIEKTWVSLGFKEEKNPKTTEDYNEIINRVFKKDEFSDIHQRKVLIIEGNPATGKTCLMRRIAFDGGKDKMADYDIVLYAEFRSLDAKSTNILEIIIQQFKKLCQNENEKETVKKLLSFAKFFEENRVLLLLDGYDESSPEKHCEKLEYLLHSPDYVDPPCHIVISTRPGYLMKQKGFENRFVCAQVLGFSTQEQKSKYISNHFPSTETNFKESIEAVEKLLKSNNELNKIAETPLLLTFICLVHDNIFKQQNYDEKKKKKKENNIVLDLYCNIIWWLLNRYQQSHQQDDVPSLFGYPESNNLSHKLLLIQDNYLEFPQVQLLSEMALQHINKNEFAQIILEQIGINEIILKVGLLQIVEYYENHSYRIARHISFPHRTIQEFLAALSYFSTQSRTQMRSTDIKNFMVCNIFNRDIKSFKNKYMTEYEKFHWRMVTSDKLPISPEMQFNFFASYSTLALDLDIFSSSAEIGFQQLRTYLEKCSNITQLRLYSQNWTILTSSVQENSQLIFTNLPVLKEMTFGYCTFQENSQLTFTNLPALEKMTFGDGLPGCTFQENSQLTFTNLPVLKEMTFGDCTFQENSQLTFTNLPALEKMTFGDGLPGCTFQENSQLTFTNLPALEKMTFGDFVGCTFQVNSQLTFKNLPVLKEMTFRRSTFQANSQLTFTNLPALEKMTIGDGLPGCTFQENSQLTFTNLPVLKEMTFGDCTFQENSQLTFTNLPLLKEMTFSVCAFQENSQLTFTNLPALGKMTFGDFVGCTFQVNSQLTFTNLPALEKMTFGALLGCTFQENSQLTFKNLPVLKEMTFRTSIFRENSQLTFTNLPALEKMTFNGGEFQENSQLTFSNLPVLKEMTFCDCSFQENSQKISRTFTFTVFSLLGNSEFIATFHEIAKNHRSS